jgi:hypothetical protein
MQGSTGSAVEDFLGAARDYLERIADGLRAGGRSAMTRIVFGATRAAGIERIAADERVDLVAMATRARGGLARLALGSVASDLLRQCCVPLLLVRPGAPAAAIGLGRSDGYEGNHGQQGGAAPRSHNVHGTLAGLSDPPPSLNQEDT